MAIISGMKDRGQALPSHLVHEPSLAAAAFLLALLLFVLRDILLVLVLNLGGAARRGDFAALVYLFCLYGVAGLLNPAAPVFPDKAC